MKKILIPLAFASVTQTIAAQTDEQLFITGQYSPVENQQLTSSVSVITSVDIEKSQTQSLSELLKQIPGVWVEDQGGAGGLSTISLRGAESNYTLVLLDGVEINDPTNTRGGAVNLNSINIESIDRIEIVRGAQSAIYGSDALAGVIHIITVNPELDSAKVYAAVGDNQFYTAGIKSSGNRGNLHWAVAVNTTDSGEQVDLSLSKQDELIGKILWKEDDHQVQWNYRVLDGEKSSYPEQSGGPLLSARDDLDTSAFKDQSSSLSWNFSFNENLDSTAKASWYHRDENYHSPGISPYFSVPENAADTEFTRQEIFWNNRVDLSPQVWANIGFARKEEQGESQGYVNFGDLIPTNFSLSRNINSAFINVNSQLTEKFLIQTSLRQDRIQSHKDFNSYQAGLSYQITDSFTWFLNINTGFKLPSFNALGHPLIRNPDLKSEEVKGRDTGFIWKQDAVSIRTSYFQYDYKNLIDFDSDQFMNVNRPGVDISGFESEITWQASSQLNLKFHTTYIDIDMPSSSSHLLGRPDVTYGVQADYEFNQRLSLHANYLSIDDRFAASQYSGSTQEEILPQYEKFDIGIGYAPNDYYKFQFKIANALNENYQTDIGFPAPKHFWRLQWTISW